MKPALMSAEDVRTLTTVSPATLDRWVKSEAIPAPIRIGRVRFWLVEEINQWLTEKAAERQVH